MGHIGVKGLKDATTGLSWDETHISSCRICALANIKHQPFHKSVTSRAEHFLYHVHSDICGPFPTGYGGYRYFILFIDDCTRFTLIFFLKQHSDALKAFIEYRSAVEKFLGLPIVYLRIDNAPEYIHGQFDDYCKANGIIFEKIVPDASQQNGVSERVNLTVAQMMRAMLLDGDLPDYFWPLAATCGVHIKNRVPHSALPTHITPFTLWMNKKPDLSHLRPFGCHVTSRCLNSDSLNKVQPCGEPGRFVGYARDSKGYLIWFPKSRSILPRRDVVFHDMPAPQPPQPEGVLWDDVPMDTTTLFGSPYCGDTSG